MHPYQRCGLRIVVWFEDAEGGEVGTGLGRKVRSNAVPVRAIGASRLLEEASKLAVAILPGFSGPRRRRGSKTEGNGHGVGAQEMVVGQLRGHSHRHAFVWTLRKHPCHKESIPTPAMRSQVRAWTIPKCRNCRVVTPAVIKWIERVPPEVLGAIALEAERFLARLLGAEPACCLGQSAAQGLQSVPIQFRIEVGGHSLRELLAVYVQERAVSHLLEAADRRSLAKRDHFGPPEVFLADPKGEKRETVVSGGVSCRVPVGQIARLPATPGCLPVYWPPRSDGTRPAVCRRVRAAAP